MSLPMRQLSTRDQNNTENNNYLGHRTAFNNEQNQYRIVIYKRLRNEKCKTIKYNQKTTYNGLIHVQNSERKTNMLHIKKRQPLNYMIMTKK